jgi:hypothetical protein
MPKRITAKAISIRFDRMDFAWLESIGRGNSDATAGAIRQVIDDLQTYFGVHELGRRALEGNCKALALVPRDHIAAVMHGYAQLAQSVGGTLAPFGLTAQAGPSGPISKQPRAKRVAQHEVPPGEPMPLTVRFSEAQADWLDQEGKESELSASGVMRRLVHDARHLYVSGPLDFRALELNRVRLGLSERQFVAAVLTEYARIVQTLGVTVRPETLAVKK